MEEKLTAEEFMERLMAYAKLLIPGYRGEAEWSDYEAKDQMWGTLCIDMKLLNYAVDEVK